jgi:hypothetical protein
VTFVYRVLAKSALLRALKIDFPPRITSSHISQTARVIAKVVAALIAGLKKTSGTYLRGREKR